MANFQLTVIQTEIELSSSYSLRVTGNPLGSGSHGVLPTPHDFEQKQQPRQG
jgi:hypothetical protein